MSKILSTILLLMSLGCGYSPSVPTPTLEDMNPLPTYPDGKWVVTVNGETHIMYCPLLVWKGCVYGKSMGGRWSQVGCGEVKVEPSN